MLNIGRDNSDKSYRYKMPPLKTKVEGRGNGIKTVIVNMVDIAKSLHVPPAYPTKFFGLELGAQSKFNKKTERAIVNGCHNASDLQKMLTRYIELFVLCPTCKLPEIKTNIKSSGIKIDCAACGHNSILKTAHRLGQYMMKNPEKGAKASKEERSKRKGKKGKRDKEAETSSESSDQTVVKPKSSEFEETWFTDTSKDAQKERANQEFAEMGASSGEKKVANILSSAKAANKTESPVTVLQIFLAQRERSVSEIVSEVRRLQLSRGFDDAQRMKVLIQAVIETDDIKTVANQFKQRSELLKTVAKDNTSANQLMGCIEELVGVTEPKLLPRTPIILQVLYEADVFTEDQIISWVSSPPEASWLVNKETAIKVRNQAGPFVRWLQEAEEESDEE